MQGTTLLFLFFFSISNIGVSGMRGVTGGGNEKRYIKLYICVFSPLPDYNRVVLLNILYNCYFKFLIKKEM